MLGCKGKEKLRQWGMVEAPRETAIGGHHERQRAHQVELSPNSKPQPKEK
jgi:hypothetical protein